MSVNALSDDDWVSLIRIRATQLKMTPNNNPGTALVFRSTSTANIVAIRNVNFNIGGIIVNKISLDELFGGVPIDTLRLIGTERIKPMFPQTVLTQAMLILGITGVSYTDFEYTVTDQLITCHALPSCSKFTGSVKLTYAN